MRTASKSFYQKIIKRILEQLKTSDEVCEVAAGTGNISLKISEKVKHIELCDYSNNMVVKAKNKIKRQNISNITCSVQDAENLNFPKESFDAVIISNALHIMPHPEAALDSIKNILKKDGILICPTFMAGENIISRFVSSLMRISGFKAYHKWSSSKFVEFIKSEGFKIKDVKIYKGILPLVFITAKKL
jgi:ubiquinone/menaquinone biosynthesis C-methylase UbiE